MDEDGRSEFQRRIGVGEPQHQFGRHVGTTKVVPVTNEHTGRVGGEQRYRWDGSVDAVVRPDTVLGKLRRDR